MYHILKLFSTLLWVVNDTDFATSQVVLLIVDLVG